MISHIHIVLGCVALDVWPADRQRPTAGHRRSLFPLRRVLSTPSSPAPASTPSACSTPCTDAKSCSSPRDPSRHTYTSIHNQISKSRPQRQQSRLTSTHSPRQAGISDPNQTPCPHAPARSGPPSSPRTRSARATGSQRSARASRRTYTVRGRGSWGILGGGCLGLSRGG